jgi:predicted nuclease of predicted toxin-antitoxin system
MKLLFDQNISFRVLRLLPDSFAGCCHVRSIGLNDCNDTKIWQYAKQNGFTVVTYDAFFFDMSVLRGFPPKIIWFRTGNLTTSEIAERIILHYANIASFIDNIEKNCLEID